MDNTLTYQPTLKNRLNIMAEKTKMTMANWLTIIGFAGALIGLFIKQSNNDTALNIRVTAIEKELIDSKTERKESSVELKSLIETNRIENNEAHSKIEAKLDKALGINTQ